MFSSLVIRSEIESDAPAIHHLHVLAFPTDMEARLVDQLRAAGRLSISLVALVDNDVVGHIAFSPTTVEGVSAGLGLAPVAVLPDHQRSGIGSQFIRQSLDICRGMGVPHVVVLGEPAYYSRFGFQPASNFGLSDTYGGGDAFQVIALVADQPLPRGVVRYAPEFDAFG